MQQKQKTKSQDIIELLGLSLICILAGYLLVSELNYKKRCLVDGFSQQVSSC